eukprot:TRINITY_DN24676_c0_g1_i1.p1 TRINITY_DN24676_c0_g1~~TRINITY_DN24676_c0_g1_i1.p1  ORF type:complete len:815 (+),score=127.04 TRINITY_DN24676_c0_g1_i1:282-2447(+)
MAALAGALGYQSRQGARLTSSMERPDIRFLAGMRHRETISGRIATSLIASALAKRESRKVSSMVSSIGRELWETTTGRSCKTQRDIFHILEDISQDDCSELLYVLNSGDVDLPQLIDVAGTSDVLQLLQDRVWCMDLVTKARLIDALHRQADFIYNRDMQELVVEIIVRTVDADRRRELNTLKGLLDGGGDYYNLHKLVYADLQTDLADTVRKHLKKQSVELLSLQKRLQCSTPCTPASPGAQPEALRKIFSDVDDTLYCSGGHFPAGVDRRYPKKLVYPGVLALFRELDQQRHGQLQPPTEDQAGSLWIRHAHQEWNEVRLSPDLTFRDIHAELQEVAHGGSVEVTLTNPTQPIMPNVAFVSARPHIYKDYAERKSYALFTRLRLQGALHCTPTLLAGRVKSSGGAALAAVLIHLRHKTRSFFQVLWKPYKSLFSERKSQVDARPLLRSQHRTLEEESSAVWSAVGEAKVNTLLEYHELYKEYSIIFFGDNGQGDLWCGEEIARRFQHLEGEKPVIFIHEVQPKEAQLSSLSADLSEEEREAEWARLGVYFHKTYLGAAVNAFRAGVLSGASLQRVGEATKEELVRAAADHTVHCAQHSPRTARGGASWAELIDLLNRDIDEANSALADASREPTGLNDVLERVNVRTENADESPMEAPSPDGGTSSSVRRIRAVSMTAAAQYLGNSGLEDYSFRTMPPARQSTTAFAGPRSDEHACAQM